MERPKKNVSWTDVVRIEFYDDGFYPIIETPPNEQIQWHLELVDLSDLPENLPIEYGNQSESKFYFIGKNQCDASKLNNVELEPLSNEEEEDGMHEYETKPPKQILLEFPENEENDEENDEEEHEDNEEGDWNKENELDGEEDVLDLENEEQMEIASLDRDNYTDSYEEEPSHDHEVVDMEIEDDLNGQMDMQQQQQIEPEDDEFESQHYSDNESDFYRQSCSSSLNNSRQIPCMQQRRRSSLPDMQDKSDNESDDDEAERIWRELCSKWKIPPESIGKCKRRELINDIADLLDTSEEPVKQEHENEASPHDGIPETNNLDLEEIEYGLNRQEMEQIEANSKMNDEANSKMNDEANSNMDDEANSNMDDEPNSNTGMRMNEEEEQEEDALPEPSPVETAENNPHLNLFDGYDDESSEGEEEKNENGDDEEVDDDAPLLKHKCLQKKSNPVRRVIKIEPEEKEREEFEEYTKLKKKQQEEEQSKNEQNNSNNMEMRMQPQGTSSYSDQHQQQMNDDVQTESERDDSPSEMDEQLEMSRRHIYEKKKNEGHKNEDYRKKLPVHSHQQKDIAEKHYFGNESGTSRHIDCSRGIVQDNQYSSFACSSSFTNTKLKKPIPLSELKICTPPQPQQPIIRPLASINFLDCIYFSEKGTCPKGSECPFLHRDRNQPTEGIFGSMSVINTNISAANLIPAPMLVIPPPLSIPPQSNPVPSFLPPPIPVRSIPLPPFSLPFPPPPIPPVSRERRRLPMDMNPSPPSSHPSRSSETSSITSSGSRSHHRSSRSGYKQFSRSTRRSRSRSRNRNR